jgi:hypothetical protein
MKAAPAAAALLAAMLAQGDPRPATRPSETRAATVTGKPFGGLADLRWLTGGGKAPAFADHAVTVVRWWTDGCPFCAASLPALEALRVRHGGEGLQMIAVYHPKPLGRRSDAAAVRAAAARLGLRGPIAIDERWEKLESLWRKGAPKAATSVTFVVDRAGIVRWVHPGPRIHRSEDREHARADADMRELEEVVRGLLDRR